MNYEDGRERQIPTARQGQFLAYIHHYSLVNGCAPAEADMQRFFQITPASVHPIRRARVLRGDAQPDLTQVVPDRRLDEQIHRR